MLPGHTNLWFTFWNSMQASLVDMCENPCATSADQVTFEVLVEHVSIDSTLARILLGCIFDRAGERHERHRSAVLEQERRVRRTVGL